MTTMAEFLRAQGAHFDEIVNPDGSAIYRTWESATIADNGFVIKMGKRYHDNMTVTDADGKFQGFLDNPDAGEFFEDAEGWAAAVGIKNYEGLLGLHTTLFYDEVNRRYAAGE